MQTHPNKSNGPEAICPAWFLWQSIILCLHLGPGPVSQLRCENTKLPLPLPWLVMAAAQQNQDEFSDQKIFSNTSQLPGSFLVFFLLFSYTLSTVRKSTAGDSTRLGETCVTWFWTVQHKEGGSPFQVAKLEAVTPEEKATLIMGGILLVGHCYLLPLQLGRRSAGNPSVLASVEGSQIGRKFLEVRERAGYELNFSYCSPLIAKIEHPSQVPLHVFLPYCTRAAC